MITLTGCRGGHRQPCRARLSGAFVTSPLEGVTGLTSWLSHGPDGSRGGREGYGVVPFFRIVLLFEMEAAVSRPPDSALREP